MTQTEFVVALGDISYQVERPWGTTPSHVSIDVVSQVAVDSQDNVYICQRVDPPIVVFTPQGEYLTSWGTGVLSDAHGIFITANDLILIVDRDAHQIVGFSPDGDVTFTLGRRHSPRFRAPFNHPTSIAAASDGELYVADGYGNSRIHRFAPDGRWLASWGAPGSEPGQFSTPHGVWITEDDHVLVADREHNRVQVFDRDGRYLNSWHDLYHPMAIFAMDSNRILVTDQIPRLSQYDARGQLTGRCRPVLFGAHGIWGDSRGNLYLAETAPMDRVTRLSPSNAVTN